MTYQFKNDRMIYSNRRLHNYAFLVVMESVNKCTVKTSGGSLKQKDRVSLEIARDFLGHSVLEGDGTRSGGQDRDGQPKLDLLK